MALKARGKEDEGDGKGRGQQRAGESERWEKILLHVDHVYLCVVCVILLSVYHSTWIMDMCGVHYFVICLYHSTWILDVCGAHSFIIYLYHYT